VQRASGGDPDPSTEATDHRTLRAFFDHALDGILIANDDGTYVDANLAACQILGYPREELLGRTPWDFAADGHGDAAREMWREFLDRGEMRGTYRMRRSDGGVRELSFSARASVQAGLHMSIIRDVTEQRQVELRLRGAQRMEAIGRLAGGVAHDFNNLLTVILGFTAEVLETYPDDPQLQFLIGEVKRAGERAADMTRQLLAFSRRQIVQPKPIDLNDTVRSMEAIFQRLIGEDVHFEVLTSVTPMIVETDPGQLEQVLTNLVVNARDAMPRGGRLSIATGVCVNPQATSVMIPLGEYAELKVSDTGVGIHPDHIANVFEPFFTTKTSGKGTGLGLATVYGIVKQAGGYILVESEWGHGATFRVLLPLKTSSRAEPATCADPLTPHATSAAATVLLVEDEPQVREVAVRLLRRAGFQTVSAATPDEALAMLQNEPSRFDVVLSDVVMPGMSGVELASHARQLVPHLPFVFMSGYSTDHAALLGQWHREEPLVPKPLALKSLVEALTTSLGRHGNTGGSA
jgi:PAS domain S-box-containing protein